MHWSRIHRFTNSSKKGQEICLNLELLTKLEATFRCLQAKNIFAAQKNNENLPKAFLAESINFKNGRWNFLPRGSAFSELRSFSRERSNFFSSKTIWTWNYCVINPQSKSVERNWRIFFRVTRKFQKWTQRRFNSIRKFDKIMWPSVLCFFSLILIWSTCFYQTWNQCHKC